jgi:hypothetical protein
VKRSAIDVPRKKDYDTIVYRYIDFSPRLVVIGNECPQMSGIKVPLQATYRPLLDPDSAIEDHTSVADVLYPLPFLLLRDYPHPVLLRSRHLALLEVVIYLLILDYYPGDDRPYLDLLVRMRKQVVLSTYYSDYCCWSA